ncbi:MAG: cupredoxin domain-containing protein [Methylocella sp.]
MARLIIFAAFFVLSVASSLPSEAGSGPAGHKHHMGGFSAGEPGDAKKPSRVIQVTMQENEGRMLFEPDRVEIRKGEQIKFVLHNSGELDHEFVLATTAENLEHAEMMKKNPEMGHADPNARRVAPKQTSEIAWKFTKPGKFEFACLIPGHRDAGMFGTVEVK